MRKRTIALSLLCLSFVSCRFGDELSAYMSGTPVGLISASGSLDSPDAASKPLEEFTHAFLHQGNLRLVMRTYFYSSGNFARPYVTIDRNQQGTLHLDVKAQFGLLTKCEFIRQVEVEIPASVWRQLKSLQVYNHDTNRLAQSAMQVSDPQYLASLLNKSQQQIALQDLSGLTPGC